MAFIETSEIDLEPLDESILVGRSIDRPSGRSTMECRDVEVAGWVLGRERPVREIEITADGTVVGRLKVDFPRPDVAEAFPLPGAERCGFLGNVALGPATTSLVELSAVFADRQRTRLGAFSLARAWRSTVASSSSEVVSVVIPCFNQAHFLREALESVAAQSYPLLDVVVVDDGSSDNTEAVSRSFPGVRCVRQDNAGLAAARNAGLRHTLGEFVLFLDADDRLLPDAVEQAISTFAKQPGLAAVYGYSRFFTSDGSTVPNIKQPDIHPDYYSGLLRGCPILAPGSVVYRRSVFEAVGHFDETNDAAADYDLYYRVSRDYPVQCQGVVTAEYRRHGSNMTRNSSRMLRANLSALRKQRNFVHGKSDLEEAYREGIRFWQMNYGPRTIFEVKDHLRHRRLGAARASLAALIRHWPAGIAPLLCPPLERRLSLRWYAHMRAYDGGQDDT